MEGVTQTALIPNTAGFLVFTPLREQEPTATSDFAAGLVARLAEFIACRLFGCDARDQFEEVFERVLEDPEYHRQLASLTELVSLQRLSAVSPRPPAFLSHSMTASQRTQLAKIGVLMAATAKASIQMHAARADEPSQSTLTASAPKAPLGYLTADHIPPVVRQILLSGDRATLAAIAVGAASTRTIRQDHLQYLLDEWHHGQFALLRFFASCEGVELPSILSKDDLLDLDALWQKTAEANASFERELEAARRSGADIYPPIIEPIDD